MSKKNTKRSLNGGRPNSFSVLVFDSGVGGITVVQAIRKISPSASLTYIADSAGFPYGSQSPEALADRILLLFATLDIDQKYDAVVIACNTASTLVLDPLRAVYTIPIIGVVPPVKTAGEVSQSRHIALLATEGTSGRGYIDNLVHDFAEDCRIFRIPCPDLALQAEEKISGRAVDLSKLRVNLRSVSEEEWRQIDTVILGCTHYPLMQEELAEIVGAKKTWLDPALPVARHLQAILVQKKICKKDQKLVERETIYFTGPLPSDQAFKAFLKNAGFSDIKQLRYFAA